MDIENIFQSVHNYLANPHAELVDLLRLFNVAANYNAELQIRWINYQLNRKETICKEQDVIAIT